MKNVGGLLALVGVVTTVAVVALVAGGGDAPATGNSDPPPPSGAGGKAVGGLAGDQDTTGITVSLGCHTTVTNLAKAKKLAYQLGKAGPTLAEAQARLFRFGSCGVSEPLKADQPRENAKNLYLVNRELWRGAVKGNHLQDFVALNLMRAYLIGLALEGVPTGDLPSTL